MNELIEYGSNIYKHNEKYYYQHSTEGHSGSVAIPEGSDSVGGIHSHHNSNLPRANVFSIDCDVKVSEMRRIFGYDVTPACDIQRYVPLDNYDEDNGSDANLGTLTWMYYNKKIEVSNGSKWFWQKNNLDKYLGRLRKNKGSISGYKDYYKIWIL